MTEYFLGVDVGGTKSQAVIADETGRVLGIGAGGPGNHEMIGFDGFKDTLHTITDRAFASAGISPAQIAGAGFGVAGCDWPSDHPPLSRIIDTLGMNAPFGLVNDAVIGLIAGATRGWGVGVVAGTGCNCWGRDMHGREGRVTGCGPYMAEFGGAGGVVMKAMQAVSLAWSKRGPETALTAAFMELTGATNEFDLLEGVNRGRYSLDSDNAPLVFRVAAAGDPVAQGVIWQEGQDLGSLAVGVTRQLGFEALEFDVVMIGSLYRGSPVIAESLGTAVHAVAPAARLVYLNAPPVAGGVMLGMEQTGLDFAPLRESLIEGVKQALQKDEKGISHNVVS